MGKINDMQNEQNNMSIKNLKNKQNQKPKLRITGWKDIATLLGPNANKKYTLSPNKKSFQLKGRVTIAAIATVLGIGAAVTFNKPHTPPKDNSSQTQEVLDKEALLSQSRHELLDIIFGENRDESDKQFYLKTSRSKDDGSTYVRAIFEDKYGTNVAYTYSNFFNYSHSKNAEEISNLIDTYMKIYFMENPSQEDLQKLNDALEELEDKNFKLDGKNIVAVDEKEKDFER